MLKEFHNGAGFFSSEDNFDDFVSLIIGTFIIDVIKIRSTVLDLELEGIVNIIGIVFIELSIEELLKNDELVASQSKVFASNKRGEESEVFSGHVSFGGTCFFKEGFYLELDGLFINHVLNGL